MQKCEVSDINKILIIIIKSFLTYIKYINRFFPKSTVISALFLSVVSKIIILSMFMPINIFSIKFLLFLQKNFYKIYNIIYKITNIFSIVDIDKNIF